MNPTVIGINSDGAERHRENEPVVTDARIKYSIRIIWRAGGHAVIIGGPSPIDDIASPDDDRTRVEVGPPLSDGHVSRGAGSKGRKDGNKKGELTEMH